MMKDVKTSVGIDFLPDPGLEIAWDPGDIELTATQRPDVVIIYVGGPIHVSPSPDPNYEPVDVQTLRIVWSLSYRQHTFKDQVFWRNPVLGGE